MAADLFYLTKTAECIRSYPDKFQDYYRGSLNDRNCDLSFHNVTNGLIQVASEDPYKVTYLSKIICLERKNKYPLGVNAFSLL